MLRRLNLYSGICFFLALLAFTVFSVGNAFAREMTYEQILEKSAKVNPGLETFKSDLSMKVYCMGLSVPLKGFLYYKRPDKLRMVIPTVPAILKNRKSMFQDMVPRSFNSKDYSGKVLGEEKIEDKVKCLLLELTPRKPGKIVRVQLWVDKESMLIPKSRVFYQNDASITSLQSYKVVRGFALPDKQKVDFSFPKFSATGVIEYQSYELNVPVDEFINKSPESK
ncbi:MAG: outer membrane lipoprotein-sorting protein [Firmicutes bacterium]|nr:outer membrane lipoprotein-sorting protein [Bacillota bacterium]